MKMFKITMLSVFMVAGMPIGLSTSAFARQDIVVSAAASLTDAFTQIGKDFESENPGVKVSFNFAASGALLQQIAQGAPVDVFASADKETIEKARQKGLVVDSSVVDFAGNKLVLVTPIGSGVKSLKELGGESVKRIAVGKPETVPAGRYTKEALEKNGLLGALEPKFIYAESVRQVLDYVARGEVDAGFAYATDAAVAADKVQVASEVSGHKPVVYPIAVVSSSKEPAAAGRFIKYVLGGKGQAVLAKYGFEKP
ncbi:MAG: molybdate ABC transporter substrate-binding protein [Nitrospirota bacterium]